MIFVHVETEMNTLQFTIACHKIVLQQHYTQFETAMSERFLERVQPN